MPTKKSFILHYDSLKVLEQLSDEQAGKLLKIMRAYHTGEEYTCDDKMVNILFVQFQNQFERDEESYKERCYTNKENGLKGGRPRRKNRTVIFQTEKNRTVGNKPYNDNDSDSDSDNKNIEYSKIPELNSAIVEWIEYKKERKEQYKQVGLKSFLTQCHSYTPASVIEQMRRAMSSGWKGVVWDNCVKIPKFNSEYDFSTIDREQAFEITKNKRDLLPQLEYQNPSVYKSLKFIFNTMEEYGC